MKKQIFCKRDIVTEKAGTFETFPCGGDVFTTGFNLMYVDRFSAPKGQAELQPHPVFICGKCNAVLDLKEYV